MSINSQMRYYDYQLLADRARMYLRDWSERELAELALPPEEDESLRHTLDGATAEYELRRRRREERDRAEEERARTEVSRAFTNRYTAVLKQERFRRKLKTDAERAQRQAVRGWRSQQRDERWTRMGIFNG